MISRDLPILRVARPEPIGAHLRRPRSGRRAAVGRLREAQAPRGTQQAGECPPLALPLLPPPSPSSFPCPHIPPPPHPPLASALPLLTLPWPPHSLGSLLCRRARPRTSRSPSCSSRPCPPSRRRWTTPTKARRVPPGFHSALSHSAFSRRLSPSLTFSHLLSPSLTFSRLLSPSLTVSRRLSPRSRPPRRARPQRALDARCELR